jgi:capsular polysaccharide export protein
MDRQVWGKFSGQRVLLLQGPVGPFFARVAAALHDNGVAAVHKINFNGGDWWFYRKDAVNYRGTLEDWPGFLAGYLAQHRIDAIVLFGDCRPLHRVAVRQAARLELPCWVFEEGYIRPNYVTFERHGVNGYSELPTSTAFYADLPTGTPLPELEVGATFAHAARFAMVYYTASSLAKPWFRHRVHHRSLNMLEGMVWWRSLGRKLLFAAREASLMPRLEGEWSKRFFLVALQTAGDSQVLTHSGFASVEDFIETVVASFVKSAPGEAVLVLKHHPLDRGYHDYASLVNRLRREHRLGERLVYVHDLHLPTLLTHARGVVVINSTVGLSALHHQTPVITLGKAIYNLPGLAFQGSLSRFWTEAEQQTPDLVLYWKFRAYVVDHTQLNGSFYKVMPGGDRSGLIGRAAVTFPATGAEGENADWSREPVAALADPAVSAVSPRTLGSARGAVMMADAESVHAPTG